MRVVTTCSKEGFERYGHRVLETWKHWPLGAELWFYTEGFSLPEDKPGGIVEISLDKLHDLQAFKNRFSSYSPPNYLFDVVRFSHKVYAAVDALRDHTGVGVWLDADCVTLQDIPSGFVENHLQRAYMAMFKRRGMYTETGFWIMDCSHEHHRDFLETWVEWYDSGAFKTLSNWTDCETLDATVRKFEKAGHIKTISLSGEHDKEMHPMPFSALGRYVSHLKGPRKDLGYCPETKAIQEAA